MKKNKTKFNFEKHNNALLRFLAIIGLFVGYFIFVSFKFGIGDGFLITWLTWSFFVLCTPIADAGFLIDFPVRLLLKVRMLYPELVVWGIALILNLSVYFLAPSMYEKTSLLGLFKHILDTPVPFWIIIVLSGAGTFLSVRFADELLDVLTHKDRIFKQKHHLKWKLIAVIFVFILIVIIYDFLIKKFGFEF